MLRGGDDAEDGRSRCLSGSYLAAVSFASAGSGLHHAICHLLGGGWDLPHAQTHAVLLPHVLAFNLGAAPEAAAALASALDAADALTGLLALYDDLHPPRSLRELGLPESALAQVAARVAEVAPRSNPRPVDAGVAESLLRRAWSGERPTTSEPTTSEPTTRQPTASEPTIRRSALP